MQNFKEWLLKESLIYDMFDHMLDDFVKYIDPKKELIQYELINDTIKNLISNAIHEKSLEPKISGRTQVLEDKNWFRFSLGFFKTKPDFRLEDLKRAIDVTIEMISNGKITKRTIGSIGWFGLGKLAKNNIIEKSQEENKISNTKNKLFSKKGITIDADSKYKKLVAEHDGFSLYYVPPVVNNTEDEINSRHRVFCSLGRSSDWCTATATGDYHKEYKYVPVYILLYNNKPRYQFSLKNSPPTIDEKGIERKNVQFKDSKDNEVSFLLPLEYDFLKQSIPKEVPFHNSDGKEVKPFNRFLKSKPDNIRESIKEQLKENPMETLYNLKHILSMNLENHNEIINLTLNYIEENTKTSLENDVFYPMIEYWDGDKDNFVFNLANNYYDKIKNHSWFIDQANEILPKGISISTFVKITKIQDGNGKVLFPLEVICRKIILNCYENCEKQIFEFLSKFEFSTIEKTSTNEANTIFESFHNSIREEYVKFVKVITPYDADNIYYFIQKSPSQKDFLELLEFVFADTWNEYNWSNVFGNYHILELLKGENENFDIVENPDVLLHMLICGIDGNGESGVSNLIHYSDKNTLAKLCKNGGLKEIFENIHIDSNKIKYINALHGKFEEENSCVTNFLSVLDEDA